MLCVREYGIGSTSLCINIIAITQRAPNFYMRTVIFNFLRKKVALG